MFGERGCTVDCTGALIEVSKDWKTRKFRLTFEINEDITGSVDSLSKYGKLTIKATKYRKKRSLDANGQVRFRIVLRLHYSDKIKINQ